MRIVLTGGHGLIGARLIEQLVSAHDVWSIVRQPRNRDGVVEIAGDLSTPDLPAGLPERADVVIHLAQSRHYRELPERADDVFAVNVASTARLLDWARTHGVTQFVLASTGAVGKPAASAGFYVASRQCAEWLAETYMPYFTVLVTRFYFAYGPEQQASMLMPRLVESVRQGRSIALSGEHGLRINPVHVADAARALAACVRLRTGGVIDVAGGETLSMRALAVAIGEAVGRVPRFDVDAAATPNDLIGDPARMIELAGPHQWNIASGLRDMVGRTADA